MKKLLEHIISEITGSKDFTIDELTEDNFCNLTIYAKPELMGLIIGKKGRTIRTIRNILKVKAVHDKVRFNLSVTEKTS